MAARDFSSMLSDPRPLFGLCSGYPAAGIITGMCPGWDFVWIDAQHGLHDVRSVYTACLAAAEAGVSTMLRIPDATEGGAIRYLDLAPHALLVPMVEDGRMAARIVQACRFPPEGNRSFGGRRFVDLYGREQAATRPLFLVAQIESTGGLERVDEIVGTRGIDAVFFGPDDMKLRLGIRLDASPFHEERLLRAMEAVGRAAAGAGKHAVCIVGDPADLPAALRMGYRIVVGGSDSGFLAQSAKRALRDLRSACSGIDAAPVG